MNFLGDLMEMMIMWVIMVVFVKSVVEYGERFKLLLNKRVFGEVIKYKICGWKEWIIYMYCVKLEKFILGKGYGKRFF